MRAKAGFKVPVVTVVMAVFAMGLGMGIGFQAGKKAVPVIDVQPYKNQAIVNEVKTAVSLLGVMELKYEQGEIGIIPAKQIARELVEGLRFGDSNESQFWIMENGQASSSGGFSMDFKPWGWKVGMTSVVK